MTIPNATSRAVIGVVVTTFLATAAPADARRRVIVPYIEVGQVLTADLNRGGDVLTYSTVAAGIDAAVEGRTVTGQASYRYEYRIGYDRRLADSDVHSGLASVAVKVAPGLGFDAGGVATRARSDIRGAAPGVLVGNVANISQIYSVYGGPTLGTHVGPVGVSGSYRIGYTKAEAPGFTGVAAGQPRFDVFDESTSQIAQASLNLKSGTVLPVGLTVSGGWARDDASQLGQRYEGKYGRGDILVPVAPTLALIGGVGYENIKISQRDVLLDATGAPVVDRNGRFASAPGAPRRIAYNFDGIYYDAGVVWRPSSRTQVEARVGERYGSTSVTGSISYQPSASVAIRVGVYDGIQTFGRQLQGNIANTPASFVTSQNVLGNDFNGCVFGAQGGAAGNCLNGALQSISTSAYRARGVDAVVSVNRGPLTFGVGAGYANRRFVTPVGNLLALTSISDESYYLQGFVARALDSRTTIDANVFANYYSSGLPGAPGVYGFGATGGISRQFGRLSARASAGIYTFGQDSAETAVSVQALLGARYQF